MNDLNDSIQYLKSVGPKRAASFYKIGITTIKDLLFYFPTRYLDRTTILNSTKIQQLIRNEYDGEVTIFGKVVDTELFNYAKKSFFKVNFKDKTGYFDCVWFQGLRYFRDRFKVGEFYAISGKPTMTRYGHIQFAHPDFDKFENDESDQFLNTGKIIPFYKLPKHLKDTNIGDISIRKIISYAVKDYVHLLEETLPLDLIIKNKFLPIAEAVEKIHFPEDQEQLKKAQERFKFEELFYLELLVALRRYSTKESAKGIAFKTRSEPINKLLQSLQFELTEDQIKVLKEIRKDMESEKPMNRLLQGDVGCGKTIVALIAMLIAVYDGYQTCIMVPTEILADQHYKKFCELLKDFNIKISLLLGNQKKAIREKILYDILNGDTKIVVGTHALFEENVQFKNLGLVVIDEQHRFGVEQRAKIIQKGKRPDVLIMTATPIPRTLSMTIYGDLDVSTISKMPKNRKPIITALRSEENLTDIYKFILKSINEGIQSFIVYPLVEESEKLELKAAETYYAKLKETHFKNVRLGLIHGKMHWQEKEKIMLRFANKEFDVLVATTVIEVGIDVPDANIIVINDASRFGLSQLHQLRGRVGRSDKQAYCILIADKKYIGSNYKLDFKDEYLSSAQIDKFKTQIRLNAMLKHIDGFKLAEIDLKLRGPGNIFGIEQSGLPELKFANIITDKNILINAKSEAFSIVDDDPLLKKESNQILNKILIRDYSEHLRYSNVG